MNPRARDVGVVGNRCQLAVCLVRPIYGPDIVSRSYIGDFVTVPSAVIVAFLAFLATWVVARRGFGQERKSE
jgi:hypothetical protein